MRPVRLASDAEAPRISCLSPNEPIARRSRGCGSPGPQAAGNAKEVAGEAIDKDDLAREAAVPRVTPRRESSLAAAETLATRAKQARECSAMQSEG
jgi:hypothetical protein